MKRILSLLLLAVFAVTAVRAQGPKPIKWRMTVKMTSDTEGVATLRAVITPGWHLYGTTMPEGGPKPTVINTAASTGLKFKNTATPSVAPAAVYDPMFDTDLTWWDTNVSFAMPFTVTGADPTVKITVSYMGCNNATCLPPASETLTYKIKQQ